MHSRGTLSDTERLKDAIQTQMMLDTKPNTPEHRNWKMRERCRSKEIGPEFRLKSNLQTERVMHSLQRETGMSFTQEDIVRERSVQKAMNRYIKSGQFNFTPGLNKDDFEDDDEFAKALQRRKTKIHQTDFVI